MGEILPIYWELTCLHQLERRAKVHSKMWFQSVARGIQPKILTLPVSSQGCCASRYFLHKKEKQSLFKTNMARLKNISNICEFLCKLISRSQRSNLTTKWASKWLYRELLYAERTLGADAINLSDVPLSLQFLPQMSRPSIATAAVTTWVWMSPSFYHPSATLFKENVSTFPKHIVNLPSFLSLCYCLFLEWLVFISPLGLPSSPRSCSQHHLPLEGLLLTLPARAVRVG